MNPIFEIKDNRLYNKDGMIAVAYTSEYGAGWSSNGDVSCFWPEFNMLIVKQDYERAEELADSKDLFVPVVKDVRIFWLAPGTEFIINQYDGLESVVLKNNIVFKRA